MGDVLARAVVAAPFPIRIFEFAAPSANCHGRGAVFLDRSHMFTFIVFKSTWLQR